MPLQRETATYQLLTRNTYTTRFRALINIQVRQLSQDHHHHVSVDTTITSALSRHHTLLLTTYQYAESHCPCIVRLRRTSY